MLYPLKRPKVHRVGKCPNGPLYKPQGYRKLKAKVEPQNPKLNPLNPSLAGADNDD